MSFFTLCVRALAAFLTAFLSAVLLATSSQSMAAVANAEASKDVFDPAMRELLAVLDEETEIATHTKLNIDFVPGMVSVLHGSDLLARGARTVLEALSYVPGIELSSNNSGQELVIVRGVGGVLATSKIKILLDGIALNSTLQASSLPMLLPIQLVDRIEMIRGPGSAIYGEFASIGVLNIVTRKSAKKFFLGGSNKTRKIIGGQYHVESVCAGADLRFSLDWNAGGRVDAESDILKDNPLPLYQDVSNAPGPINDKVRRSYISLSCDIDNYQFQWQWLERANGDFFGAANALPRNSDSLLRKVSSQNINISKKFHVNRSISANYKFGWLRSALESKQHELFPPGVAKQQVDPDPTLFDPTQFVDGVLGGPHYEEDKYYLQAEANIVTKLDHELLIGMELSQVKQGETYANRNYKFDGGFVEIPNQRYTGADNWLKEGLKRQLLALYIQDQYALAEDLHIITGIRYDQYDDIGSDVTPRIASVYQIDRNKTFKVQFAQSFRPPLFIEMYSQNNPVVNGNPNLKSERLDSFEVGYAWHTSLTLARATAYHYRLRDVILNDALTSEYMNKDEVTADGIEFEFQREITRKLKFDYTMSLIHALNRNDRHQPNIAKLILAASIFYTPAPDWSTSMRYRYESDRDREPGDSREPLSELNIVDLTLAVNDLVYKGIILTASVYNLFDAEVKHPSSKTTFGQFNLFTYKDDYPQLGRELAISLQYNFR